MREDKFSTHSISIIPMVGRQRTRVGKGKDKISFFR